jgi:heme A synthase
MVLKMEVLCPLRVFSLASFSYTLHAILQGGLSESNHALTFHHYTFNFDIVMTDIVATEPEFSTPLTQKLTTRLSHFTLKYVLLTLFFIHFIRFLLKICLYFLFPPQPLCWPATRYFSFVTTPAQLYL